MIQDRSEALSPLLNHKRSQPGKPITSEQGYAYSLKSKTLNTDGKVPKNTSACGFPYRKSHGMV